MWADQSSPPPPIAGQYSDPGRPPHLSWPPRVGADQAHDRRLRQAVYLTGPEHVQLDPARCRFTYTRLTLAGTVVLGDDEHSRRGRWTGPGLRALTALDAVPSVLMVLRWTLSTVYEQRPEDGGLFSDLPLPGLSLTVRES